VGVSRVKLPVGNVLKSPEGVANRPLTVCEVTIADAVAVTVFSLIVITLILVLLN
jgi:hypothetical protein